MIISLIAAMAQNRVIGKGNDLPWHLPADLQHFKRMTLGKPIIMGRKTFESIGKPLPKRDNIVLTRNPDFHPGGVTVFADLQLALEAYADQDEVMIVGGGHVYAQALPVADRLYLTLIDADTDGDTHFPAWNEHDFREVSREHHPADGAHAFSFSFVTLERV